MAGSFFTACNRVERHVNEKASKPCISHIESHRTPVYAMNIISPV